jgi:hypothetical protein
MKIACPMCSFDLQNPGAVEEASIEYTTLSLCARCGFGLNLRWHGRGSALAKPVPDLILVGDDPHLLKALQSALPDNIQVMGVPSALEALGIYARALRLGRTIYSLLILQPNNLLKSSEIALALRSLEEGFQINQPAPLWFFSSQVLDRESKLLLKELREIYWRSCEVGQESHALIESIPPLFHNQ